MSLQILLSTYNGEKFIREQLDSLINQTYKNLKILIRDDGSTDSTCEILKEYKNRFPDRVDVIYGDNVGQKKSFFLLVENADPLFDFYAFCDQDDFWMPEKIETAVNKLEEAPESSMYFSNLTVADEKLKPLKQIFNSDIKTSFNNSLLENYGFGCTQIFSNKVLKVCHGKLKNADINKIIMHDWFFYIIGSCIGQVIYDQDSYILYRQHGANTIGTGTNRIKQFFLRIKIILKYGKLLIEQDRLFYEIFNDILSEKQKSYLLKILDNKTFIRRLKIVLSTKFDLQNRKLVLQKKVLFILGLLG